MTGHLNETRINDYLDSVLAAADRAALEAHTQSCALCRNQLESVRELLVEVRALPRAIRPERDLLPGIHDAIDRDQVLVLRSWRARSLWSLRWAVATAAVLLIMATAVITQAVAKKGQAASVATASAPGVTLVNRDLAALEQKYTLAITELQQLIAAQSTELAPGTLRLLERNLQVIDTAIRESRAALEQEPGNAMINEMLWSAYEKKLELLRRATTIVST